MIDAGLVNDDKYNGMAAPAYYVATVSLPNSDGRMMPGMSGDAKIAVQHGSLVGLACREIREFADRKIW
jgi:hypothetical protein